VTRRVCLFLGAGASAEAGVPPTFEFVSAFREDLHSKIYPSKGGSKLDPVLLEVLNKLLRVLQRWKHRRGIADDRVDVETLLEGLSIATSPKEQIASALLHGNPVAVTRKPKELGLLLEQLRTFIREKCYVQPHASSFLFPLRRFINENRPIHVFTVNYDLVMEQWFEQNSRTFTDGFDLDWNPAKFAVEGYDAYLYKLHGSVTWYKSSNGTSLKIPMKVVQRRFTLATGGYAEPLMLYPAQKWVNSGVFLRLLGLLHEVLGECDTAVVVGYSFRDDHFVRAFQEAAVVNPRLRVILVSPHAEDIYQDRLKPVQSDSRAGTPPMSALARRVVRVPYRYGSVIRQLYTSIWTLVSDARISDESATRSWEQGSAVKWDELAIRFLEAGWTERATELESDGIEWAKASSSFRAGFFARKAIILASLGTAAHPLKVEAAEAWAEMILVLEDVIHKRLGNLSRMGLRAPLDRSVLART
jgi:hypothetical protein